MNVFGKQDIWFPLQAENLRHVDPEVIPCIQDTERMNQGYDALVLLLAINCPVLFLQADAAAVGSPQMKRSRERSGFFETADASF